MTSKPEIFAVIWVDRMVGPLSLHKPNAASAIALAASMAAKGKDKIDHVRAVHIAAGSMVLETLASF